MKYLFGPVNSRRLGLSLGVDLLPAKICNFNCIYCEVGPTTQLTCERKEYIPTGEIIAEIDEFVAGERPGAVDVFTITGSGEPTLHSGIGRIIRHLKEKTSRPVVVLTNGSLFHLPEVRQELASADIVIPSLDSALSSGLRKINRPATGVELTELISGLADFTREFKGMVWLEILLVKGINDSQEEIAALREAVAVINPERVQLNTVARPPLEAFAAALSREDLAAVAARLEGAFAGRVEVLAGFSAGNDEEDGTQEDKIGSEEVVQMLRRRPCTAPDICEALQIEPGRLADILRSLEQEGRVRIMPHNGDDYYHVGQP